MRRRLLRFTGALFASTAILAGQAGAQTFAPLHSFTGTDPGGKNADGAGPYCGLVASGNVLFGTALGGGAFGNGTVYSINTNGTGFTNLHDFTAATGPSSSNSDGYFANGTLVLAGNALYGVAAFGGTAGNGTIFRVNTNGTAFTNLHNFTAMAGTLSTNGDGATPFGGLAISGGQLYGVANAGGLFGNGSVFRINTDGTGFTNLHSFTTNGLGSTNSDGASPKARLVVSGSMLYGAALSGGAFGNGTVFKLDTNGNGFTTLHHFTAMSGGNLTNSDGANPESGLALDGSTLFGVTSLGGPAGDGALFSISTNGGVLTKLHGFAGADGRPPAGDVIVAGGKVYGVTQFGGDTANGNVFEMNTNGSGFVTLYGFTAPNGSPATNSDGAQPLGGLIIVGNTLYGTANLGGAAGNGTLFALDAAQSPLLNIALQGSSVVLTWPADATGFVLQSNANLTIPSGWQTVVPAPTNVSGQNIVTNTISGPRNFYRLIR